MNHQTLDAQMKHAVTLSLCLVSLTNQCQPAGQNPSVHVYMDHALVMQPDQGLLLGLHVYLLLSFT